ncbi:hypothetical protein PVL30_000702 [Lodderomyces elongisporus]|uniref:uncharacterized protein n=1 Tax=Lodderomyces elongisporus TaxID=36914 RepID=UPI002924A9FC|nr:uncharacterized protein PVL30_000702 [Lodderomyces elongisporus]WLF76994.1 hypothetical protein PVL30_000702 [Lodderomyces elongisporus]
MSVQSPLLSYKKPRREYQKDGTPSAPSTPTIANSPTLSVSSLASGGEQSNQSSLPSQPATPVQSHGARKISSRRKALQEYYHLQQKKNNATNSNSYGNNNTNTNAEPLTSSTTAVGNNAESHDTVSKNESGSENDTIPHEQKSLHTSDNYSSLKTTEDVERFIQSSTPLEILKLRNTLQSRIDSSSQQRKELMYGHYNKLIKLSQTLGKFSESTVQIPIGGDGDGDGFDKLNGLRIFKTDANSGKMVEFDKYLNDCISELKTFNETSVKKMTGPFDNVLEKLNE